MRRETPVHQTVFNKLYPQPQSNVDPSSWMSFVRHCLVKEVRHEIHHYYGCAPESLAQRYPGFDYNCSRIRSRLSRYTHHKRLFQALDELELTANEINELCCWEGTLAAKRKFERDHGVTIAEPCGEEIPHWDDADEVLRRQARAEAREAQLAAAQAQSSAGPLANTIDNAADDEQEKDENPIGTHQDLTHVIPSTGLSSTPIASQIPPPQDATRLRERLAARQIRSQSLSSLANSSTHALYTPITPSTPLSSTSTLASDVFNGTTAHANPPAMAVAAAATTTAAPSATAPLTANPAAATQNTAGNRGAASALPTLPFLTPLLSTRPSTEELARTIVALLHSPHAREVATLLEDFFKDVDEGSLNEGSNYVRTFLQQLRG